MMDAADYDVACGYDYAYDDRLCLCLSVCSGYQVQVRLGIFAGFLDSLFGAESFAVWIRYVLNLNFPDNLGASHPQMSIFAQFFAATS